jgi:hypothetical protein
MNPIPNYPVQDDDPEALSGWTPEFPFRTRGGRWHRPIRCRDCKLSADKRIEDFDDGKAQCSVCGLVSAGKFNESGLMFS